MIKIHRPIMTAMPLLEQLLEEHEADKRVPGGKSGLGGGETHLSRIRTWKSLLGLDEWGCSIV